MTSRKRSPSVTSGMPAMARLTALSGVPLVKPGDGLVELVLTSLAASDETLQDGDVVVIAQKIVSKAQNRIVHLRDVQPSLHAEQLAREVNKDPRLVELVLRESTDVVRHRQDVLIVAHKLGLVIANAGIDQSNMEQSPDGGTALLLPEDPDGTCEKLGHALRAATGAKVGVIINDSHGRAFRNGTVGVAIGSFGVAALTDLRGVADLYSRRLQSTEVGVADEIASAASLLMGQANEGRPLVLVRGIPAAEGRGCAADLIRKKELDLFRMSPGASIIQVMSERRSIRRYQPTSIPKEIIYQILQCAIGAPSAHNRQPWRFALLESARPKERLAAAMGARLREDRNRDRDAPDLIEIDVSRSIARITGAPVVIVVCLTTEVMDSYPDKKRNEAERFMAVQSTAMAMQNILLAAHALALGSSIMCAPLFCQHTVRKALGLPTSWEPQALITLGIPANNGKPYARRPLGEVIRILEY